MAEPDSKTAKPGASTAAVKPLLVPARQADAFASKLQSQESQNRHLRTELELMKEQHAQILIEERKADPLNPTARDHAVLAGQHTCETISLIWLSCRSSTMSLVRTVCGCERSEVQRPRMTSSPSFAGARGKQLLAPGEDSVHAQASSGLGNARGDAVLREASPHEAHLARRLRRSNTSARIRDTQSSDAMRKANEGRVPEDKPETVAAMGMWCSAHVTKQTWDFAMLTLIVYSCVVIPYRIGMSAPISEGLGTTVDHAITMLFIIDLSLNFNTAYAEGTHFVTNRRKILANYLSGWFWIDIASSFPFEDVEKLVYALRDQEMAEGSNSTSLKLLRALRLFRLVRLLKLLKLQQYIDSIEDKLSLNLQVLQIVKMVLGLIYLMHILGCFWFFVATNAGYTTTWLSEYDNGSGLSAPVDVQYLYAIYWALMTLTTVGYGDITPANNAERGYALFALLIGALIFGWMLSAVGELIGSLDKGGARLQEKLDDVKEFTRWHQMPPELAARVRKYYEFYYSRQSAMDEDAILGNFAPSLKHDVMAHLLAQSVGLIQFFYVPVL